ncbi:Tetratricopeptide repeat-containing protein [Armatimonadetes bacterium DC]|nr:Tetratricopeptide repeat-containing protein [Armatimonadetes bacterium DC]
MNSDIGHGFAEVISLIESGEYSKAEAELRHILSVAPDHADAHFLLGVVHMEQRHWDTAIEAFERATQLAPDFSSAWHNLGYCYDQMGFPDRAVPYLTRALEVRPDKWDSHLLLGLVLIQLRRFAEAAEHLEQALQHGGEEAPRQQIYETLANIYEALGLSDRAARYWVLQEIPDEAVPALQTNPVEHLFLFSDAESAMLAAEAYQTAGYEARFLDDPEEETYCVVVYDNTPLEDSGFERVVERLKQIAEQYGGEYDGWGVAP